MPVFIASAGHWPERFEKRGLPLIGDDIKSQVGATITHRVLTRLFRERGVKLSKTYQLNFGGNTDFYNMLERERLESKKISKTQAVTSQLDYDLGEDNIHVGPSDHIPWLEDRKWCHIRMEGETFGGVPLNLELKLEVWDSPNSAGVVIDAVRLCKLALNHGIKGPLMGPSSYLHEIAPQTIQRRSSARNDERFHSPVRLERIIFSHPTQCLPFGRHCVYLIFPSDPGLFAFGRLFFLLLYDNFLTPDCIIVDLHNGNARIISPVLTTIVGGKLWDTPLHSKYQRKCIIR